MNLRTHLHQRVRFCFVEEGLGEVERGYFANLFLHQTMKLK